MRSNDYVRFGGTSLSRKIQRAFTQAGCAELAHPEIAKIAREHMPTQVGNPDWWAQGVAIAFEQQMGLRVPGQSSTGTFRVSASRTLTGDRTEVIDAWEGLIGGKPQQGHALSDERRSTIEKRSFWRATVGGAGKLDVSATPKGDDKSILVVEHTDLASEADIEVWRAHWKAKLQEL